MSSESVAGPRKEEAYMRELLLLLVVCTHYRFLAFLEMVIR